MSEMCKHGVRNTKNNLPYCRRCDDEGKAHSLHRPGSEARSEIHYPCVVDAKLLSALTMCGDAIIRDPRPDRIKHWARLRARIHKQAKPLNDSSSATRLSEGQK